MFYEEKNQKTIRLMTAKRRFKACDVYNEGLDGVKRLVNNGLFIMNSE